MTTATEAGVLARILRELRLMAAALAGLVWPVSCAGCGDQGVPLCPCCAGSLSGRPFARGSPPLLVWGLSAYGGTAARLIVAWKAHGRHDLSRPLGAALARAVDACLAPARPAGEVWLVPMPSRRAARRARGADLPFQLARSAARRSGGGAGPVRAVRVLAHTRTVRDQVGLDAAARRRNLHGALRVRRRPGTGLAGRLCVIVDDIVTTGASAAEAARVLTESGAQVVGVCCLSVTLKQQGVPATAGRTSLGAWKAPSGR